MQHHALVGIAQSNQRPSIGAAAIPQCRHLGGNRPRRAERVQRLIDQVRRQIEPQPRSGRAVLAPTVDHVRAIAIVRRLEMHHPSDRPLLDRGLDPHVVAVPAPIVEHRQAAILRLGHRYHLACFGQRGGERLLDHDMLAGLQRGNRQRCVRGGGRGDDDEIDLGIGDQRLRRGHDRHVAQVGTHRLGLARCQLGYCDAWHGRDQRTVKHPPRHAIADKSNPDHRESNARSRSRFKPE